MRMEGVLICQFLACSYEISASALRGMGESMLPTLFTIFGTCVLRMVWVFLVAPFYKGFPELLQVYPLSWVLTGTMVLTAYFRYTKKHCPSASVGQKA